jgi:hypothetical protein
MKRLFLVSYDYGMGGVWAVIHARTVEEIQQKFPALSVTRERPPWMTEDEYRKILKDNYHDIDDEPSG